MLNKKIEEIEKVIKGMATDKAVEVEVQERSTSDPYSAQGLITDEIITTVTLYDKQELTPVQEFVHGNSQSEMKVFVCNDHDGHWPVPTASVIVANSGENAADLLRIALQNQGLGASRFTLEELDLTKKQVVVLSDGEY